MGRFLGHTVDARGEAMVVADVTGMVKPRLRLYRVNGDVLWDVEPEHLKGGEAVFRVNASISGHLGRIDRSGHVGRMLPHAHAVRNGLPFELIDVG